MATEADFPEAISVTKGEGDRYLFDRNVEQCSPLELNKPKGELDQHHEIEKPFADSENVKVDCSTLVESKNSFGISEGEHFLAPLSEISQAEQSNQAGMEIAKTEDAKLQVERVEASKSETTVDQHVQAVISNQQDSTKENLQRLENEAETSEVDVKRTEKADGNAESYRKEDSGLLDATTFQEYEASSSTLEFTNNSLKKDIEMETNVDNTSSTNPIFQEEFKEETSTKVTSNIEDDSQQTMHKYEPEEEVQKFPEVMPENAKTESASENAEVITCTDEERAIQNTKEYSEKEDANPVHGTEKVFEATRTEQVTGEHALPEIPTAEDHPQEFDEENSTNLQACVEAANLSANTEEKNLVEEVIQEKCSSLVEEQTTEKISREEEIHVTDLKKEEKEADAKYEEPIEVADTTREIEFETIEQRTETNKDLYVPIPEEEAYAEESTKAFVQNNSCLSEISEVKTKEIIQEVCPTVSDYSLVSGEVSHVSGSKEAEAENKEHVENNPEEKALQTILTNEMALETEDHAQAEEGLNSKENMEREIQTAEDEEKRDVKETSIVLEEEGPATILTDQTALQTEDVELQAEENVDSKDILEKQIPTAADEGENGLMEAQAENNEKVTDTDITTEEKGLATIVTDEGDTGLKEAEEANKEQVKISDISPEEKVLPAILTDEAALDIEDIDVQAEKNSNSKENLEKQIPVVADEGLKEAEEESKEQVKINDSPEEILTDEAALDNEEIELQGEENVNSKDNSEKQIPTVADEGEICLAKAEAENNEQATITDITPEEKGLATISTDEKALDTEDIDVQAEESFNSEEKLEELIPTTEVRNTEISPEEKDLVTILANETSLDIQDPAVQAEETFNSKENLEKQISEAPDKGDTCLKEAGEENKEQVKNTYISPEEKGQETIIIDETTQDIEYIDVQAGENFISKEILEIPKAVDEDETDLTEAEAENKEHVETTEKGPEEKGLATILTDETAEDIEYNDAQAAEINSKEVLEKQIPTAVGEGETDLTEAEADYKEHVDYTDIAPEQKGVETILRDEPALELEDVAQEQENFNSKENLENQIPTAVDEGEADLDQGEAENKEQVKNSDITVLRDETALDIEDLQAKENQIPKEASEGEEKVCHEDIVFDHTPVNVYSTELVRDNTVEESFQVQSHEEAEQKLGVKDEKSEDHPERNDMIVEEVLEEPKITSRDFKEEEIIGGNVTIFTPESIEEDTVKNSQDNEKEENANDLSPEYIPEDGSEMFKDDKNDAVKSEGEILEHSQNVGVEESTTCETKNVKKSEEILSTLPVKYDQESSPAPKEALKEENIDEDTFSVQAAKDNDRDNGAVTVTETCAKAPSNDEEDSPQVLKYEPEETIPESSNENAEVITCTKEEIQESLDKECDTSTGEACNEAAELGTEGEKEKQTTQEVSSSLIGEETTEESSKEEENFVTIQEEKNEKQEMCKEAIEAKSETLEDTTEPKPISEEESNKSLVEDNSFLSEASEKEIEKEIQSECSCTVTNFDSKVVSDETGLSDATAENKEQVETTYIAPEEKDNVSTGVYNTELVGETIVEPSFQVQPPEEEEEAEPKLEVENGTDKSDDHPEKNNKILEEVLDEPKITDRDFNEEQITEGNVVNFATESIVEETVTNYQDDEKETEKLNEEGSSIENIKEGNANDISTECVPEDRGEKLEECIGEAVESKEEILQESQTDGSGENTTRDTTGAEKTEEETSLQNEEPREVKVSNLALEKLDSDATEEEATGGSEVVPESDSKSIDVVTKDELIADQTLDEGISKEPTLLAEEKELRASEHELETTSQDKNIEEEHAKEVEVPTADDTGDLLAPRSAEETCLPKEEPRELKVSELALEKLEAGESEEEIKETFETVSKFDSQSTGVVSKAEILEHTQTTTCEIKNVERYEEIVSTLPVKYDQGSSPAPTEASKEENIDEDTFSVREAKDNIDGDNGAVTVTETCAKITSNDEEDSPQVLKYEPGEEITKFPDVLPEETIPESSSENAVVITCTNEEIRESLDKESDTSTGEVLETTSTETGEHASLEVNHPQGFNDKETTEGNATEYQACNEAAELSTEGEKEKQTTQEVSSEMIGEETTEESSKEKEQFVTSLQEETNEEHEVCKKAIEAKCETLEDTTEPKPISEEESNKSLVEDNSFLSEASEIQGEYSSTVRNFDSEVVSNETGLTEATAENKEQVETTHIISEEKDNAGTGVYNTELVGETIVEPSFQVQPLEEEAEPKLEVEDETNKSDGPEKNNRILEEVLDEPKITDRDFNEEQITEGNVVNFATESIVEETVTNYQDDEKKTEKLNEGSSTKTIKEGNANDISTECVPEDRDEKLEECIGEAVESKEEILQESQIDGLGEITACDTSGAEKTDSEAPEEETTGGSEVVPESDSKSIDVVTKDEIIADQTLDEDISKESSTLLAEEKELRASEHEHGTTSQDKNIEEEHAKEVEVPTADDTRDLLAPRSAEETCLPKEEPRELKVSELALEKLEAGESEEEIKETFETVSKFDSQSTGVVSKAEILEHTQTTTCEIKNVERYEEIVSILPVKYDQGSSPALTEASTEENIDENTFSVQEAKDNIDGDNGAVTVTETCAKITSNDEEDSPQVLKYEPGEEITKLPDVLPEETIQESSRENAEVITCTKEEIQESLDKECDTSTGEVLETTSTETGEHESPEVNHPQGLNDKETTEGNATEYQACNEVAELSTEGENQKQTTQEVASSLIGEETIEESSKEEDNFVTSLQEEKNEEHEVCKEAIEAKYETLEDTTEPKPISEEESNKSLVEDNSFLSEASEIQGEYSSPVRNFDSAVVSDKTGLTEATAENKEQVETTHIALEEKDNAGTGVYNTELVRETIVEPSFQVQPLEEEAELKLEVEDETDKSDGPEKNNRILEEVLDEPKITDRDFNEEQITEGNVVNFATESIVEETVTNYQDDEKKTEKLNEEGSSTKTIKEGNANDISTECVPEDRDEKLEECIGEAVESKEEILQESQIDGLGEITACDTSGAEKTDSEAPDEETTGGSEVVPESDSKSIDVVTKDEIIADQTLDEDISKEPSTLLAEEKEIIASEHEHGTTSQDKNIEEEHAKEVEVPTADDTRDLFAPRSAEETCLPKEEPRERVSELALEKLEAGESKEEIKETFETVSKFDSQSIGVLSEDEIITDQTQCEGITDVPLQIPSYTLLPELKDLKASEVVQETLDADTPEEEVKDGSAMVPKFDSESTDEVLKDDIISDQTLQEGLSTEQLQTPSSALLPEEKELGASEHEHETTTVDKNLDEENPTEVEVPADEDKPDLYTATPAKETCLQADEPKDSELAVQKLDAGEIEEEIKGTFETVSKSDSQSIVVASGDDILADQTLCEGVTDPPLSKDREFGATELALEKLDVEDTEEIKVPEIVTKFDSESIEIVSNNEVIADQTFNEGITKEQIQSPSSTLLPEEKEQEASEPEHETTAQDKNTEQECTKEVEVSADEDTQALFAAGPVEEKSLRKEELNVSELAQERLDAGDTEEANETFETDSKPDFPSTAAVSSEEITADETVSKGVTDMPLEIPSYTTLHEEKERKASELNLEKLDADIPEEEIKEGSEVIPQSNSQSTYEALKDEIIADQLQIPSPALLPDGKELKASENEYETTTDDKNIEDENLKEVEEPTGEATQDLFAARSAVEKEEPSELKVPELALEKLDADETQEVKETFEIVSKSDSESIYAVSKNELTDEHTVCDVITDMPLHIPSYTSLTKENELNASELALEKLDANATEEVKEGSEVTHKSDLQSIDVVVKDEIIADQVLHEVITKDQLHIQSSILLPEENELKESEHEHGTATQYKNLEEEYAEEIEVTADEDTRDLFVASSEEKTQLQKEEPRELKVSELAPENLNVGETEEEVTENCERVSKPDPEGIDAVSKDESIAERTLHQSDEQLQIASPTLLPKEKEEATVQKEEPEDCKVPELALKELDARETEEETQEAFETVPEFSSQSIGELATDEIVDQIPPSLLTAEKRCENTTTIDNAEEKSMNVVETPNDESRKDTNIAEETSIPNEEPRELNLSNLEFHLSQDTQRDNSNEVHEEEGCSLKEVPKVEPREDEEEEIYVDSNETKKNEASNEERNLELATSDSRAEDWCETTIEANETAKIEVPNEEIKDEKEVAKDSQLIYVGEENIRTSQQENESRAEKYPEEKNETFNTAPSENHHEVTNPMEKDSSVEISQEGILGFEEAYGNTRDIKQLEKESHATNIPSSNEAALDFLQDPTLEDTKPSNDTLVATETKEEKVSESGVETADSTSAQISERLMNESTKERMKVITHLTGEKESTDSKELQADKEAEDEEEHENVEEAKTDEEKEDTEHKRTYQGYDEPVIVEASTDTEVKVKKSHSILSGMGSKVKHSISKVKKAIIGKSSNSKTQSEK